MLLRTFGGLAFDGADLVRTKPLLLLAYLSLEGPQERRFVAELFWMGADRPLSSLSVALSFVRKAAAGAVAADDTRVWTELDCDAHSFLERLDRGERDAALELYRGQFLHGVRARNVSAELDEWLVATREYLATRARRAMLDLAGELARHGSEREATRQAEAAYRLAGASEPEPEEMTELYALLRAGGSPRAAELEQEASEFGLDLAATPVSPAEDPPATGHRGLPHAGLPTPATPLVGRDPERLEIARLLTGTECRLLTLTGPGGTGKTRLALQVALDLRPSDAFPDGVFMALLDALTDPAQIPLSLAEALDLGLTGAEDPLRQVARSIGQRRCLLVLDNFEQLIDGTPLLTELLGACGQLTLLVSSRERLNLSEEWTFPLDGLAYPEPATIASDDLRRYDAVQLFLQRARRVNLRFSADDTDLEHILAICRLVEGSPLGIELAACWVRLLTPEAIAREVQQNLDFLEGAPRDAPERHRNLRAVFEHSWQQLTTREQAALRKLAVFRGGFRREAAAEVAAATVPVLAGLVDKSLLRVTAAGRYDRHALLYQYMREKLEQDGDEWDRTRAGHGRYFARFVRDRYRETFDGNQGRALGAMEQDLENIRSAWSWAAAAGEAELLLSMCDPVRAFHDTRARYQEGYALFEQAARAFGADRPDAPDDPVLARARGYSLVLQAWFASWLGRYDEAARLAGRGVELLRPDGRPDELAQGLNIMGTVALNAGAYQQARNIYLETVELVDGRRRINALNNLATAEDTVGNYREAIAYYQEALAWNRSTNNASQIVINIINLAESLKNFGHPDQARELLLEALALAREHGFHQTLPYVLSGMGSVLCELGERHEARAYCEEALALHEEHADPINTIFTLSLLGRIATELGEVAEATNQLVRALELAASTQTTAMSFHPIADAAALLAHQQDDRAAPFFELILRHPVSDHATKESARERLAELTPLPPAAAERASARGEALSSGPLAEAIALLTEALAARLEL